MILTNKKNSGFTLIELLVVIAIIGVLSSVIMAGLNRARINARDSTKNQLVRQYVNAIELANDQLNGYPYPDENCVTDNSGDCGACLGKGNLNGVCAGGISENNHLNNVLANYIPGPPASTLPVDIVGEDYRGIYYGCIYFDDNGICQVMYLEWVLEAPYNGDPSQCGVGRSYEYEGYAFCSFSSDGIY